VIPPTIACVSVGFTPFASPSPLLPIPGIKVKPLRRSGPNLTAYEPIEMSLDPVARSLSLGVRHRQGQICNDRSIPCLSPNSSLLQREPIIYAIQQISVRSLEPDLPLGFLDLDRFRNASS
jgi:hypothetical protein